MSDDCIFCKIANGKIPSSKIYEDSELLAFNDINPAAPHHVLIIPKRHIATLNDADGGTAELLGRMQLRAAAIAQELGISESGYRTVINCNRDGGQVVFHLHLHIIGGRTLKGMG